MKRRDFVRALGAGSILWWAPARVIAQLRPLSRHSGRCLVERWSWAMGQPVHLQLYAETEDHGLAAAAAALDELRQVEARLSLFDDRSDLSELNRRAGRGFWRADRDLLAMLRQAVELQRRTNGAFNLAVEPLMRAWGFRDPRRSRPTAAELTQAEAAVRAARIDLEGNRVRLGGRTSRLDPGGIGVGYGLDRAAAVLRSRGIERALLDVSGDCIALGAPPGEAGWRIGIADSARPGLVLATTLLRDQALATSSNQVNVVQLGGRKWGHIMNPADGWPGSALRQATAVAPSGIEADALSTAMIVAGRSVGPVRAWCYPGGNGRPPGPALDRTDPAGGPSHRR